MKIENNNDDNNNILENYINKSNDLR